MKTLYDAVVLGAGINGIAIAKALSAKGCTCNREKTYSLRCII